MFILKWLDGCLLAATQKFSDGFQWLTGLTKFRLEKWALVLALASLWLAVFSVIDFFFSGFLVAVMNTVSTMSLFRLIERAEAEFLATGRLLFAGAFPAAWRQVALFVYGIMGPYSLLLDETGRELFCFWTFNVGWMYFSSCVPRPPGKSKVREWYEAASTWLDDRLTALPEPVHQ